MVVSRRPNGVDPPLRQNWQTGLRSYSLAIDTSVDLTSATTSLPITSSS
jgi:hypothetical protein